MNEDSQQTKEAMDEYIRWIIGTEEADPTPGLSGESIKARNKLRKEQLERAGLEETHLPTELAV